MFRLIVIEKLPSTLQNQILNSRWDGLWSSGDFQICMNESVVEDTCRSRSCSPPSTCWDVDEDTPALHCDLSHLILYDQYVSTSSVCCLSEWLDVLLTIPIPKQGCQTIQLYCVVLVVNCAYKCLLEFLQRLFCCVYSSIHIAVFTHYHCVLQSFVLPDILFFLQFRPFKRGFLSFHIPLPFSFCFLLCYSA